MSEMTDKETIKNLSIRLILLSNVMTDMFKVVAQHIPVTNESFKSIVIQWELIERQYPLANEQGVKDE